MKPLQICLILYFCWAAKPVLAEEVTAEDIFSGMDTWRNSFSSLRLIYEVHFDLDFPEYEYDEIPTEDVPPPVEQGMFDRHEFIWSEKGMASHLHLRFEDQKLTRKSHEGMDGTTHFETAYNVDGDGAVSLKLKSQSGRPGFKGDILPLMGVFGRGLGAGWGRDNYEYRNFQVLGPVQHNGQEMVAATFDRRRGIFDPTHSFLPVAISDAPDSNSSPTFEYIVSSFVKMPNGFPIPSSGTLQIGLEHETSWRVISAEPDYPVSHKTFQPPALPERTVVNDRIKRITYVVGPSEKELREEFEERAEEKQLRQSTTTQPDEDNSTVATWFSFGLIAAGLCTGILALMLRFRSQRC